MEKTKLFMSDQEENTWISCSFAMEMQGNVELNGYLGENWEKSMDQSDPFESALSSIVSSPVATSSNANAIATTNNNEAFMIRELIERLGNICNSGEIWPQSYINSTNTSCCSTPLNSPPNHNLSMNTMPIPGNHPHLAPFSADPGFAERAEKYSCFGSLNRQLGLTRTELPNNKVFSNLAMKTAAGSQVNVQESKKFSSREDSEVGDSREGSSVSEQIPVGELSLKGKNDGAAKKRKSIPRGKAKETASPSRFAFDAKASEESNESSAKRSKSDDSNGNEKDTGAASKAKKTEEKQNKDNPKPPEPPKDYIHVRARRGQATDSHSLAERVRREKISERMKFLQDLVPGCNKVTGKAVMLDEIINYVQSLQRQVEFLSMKLATINPRMDFNIEALASKGIFQFHGSMPHALYPLDSLALPTFPCSNYQRSQQGMLLNNAISNNAGTQFPMGQLNTAMRQNPSLQLPPLDGYGDAAPQVSTLWEDDLRSVVQMGFGHNQQPSFHGSVPEMKIGQCD